MPKRADRTVISQWVAGLVERTLSMRVLSKLSEEEREELHEDIELVERLIGEQRVPRVAVVGSTEESLPGLVKSILGESLEGDPTVKEKLGRRRWYDYECTRGTMRLLDLRIEPGETDPMVRAITREAPDVVLFVWRPGREDLVAHLERVIQQASGTFGHTPAIVAAISEQPDADVHPGQAERELRRALVASTVPNESFDVVMRAEEARLVEMMLRRAPMEVRVRLAHLTWVREVKYELAETIVRAASGIAGAVATIPVPVADTVPLTALQLAMVASVAHVSGRELSIENAREAVAVLGANLGFSFAARQAARTAVRFVPLAGSVVSAGIASSATYGLGQAAIGYFIGERA